MDVQHLDQVDGPLHLAEIQPKIRLNGHVHNLVEEFLHGPLQWSPRIAGPAVHLQEPSGSPLVDEKVQTKDLERVVIGHEEVYSLRGRGVEHVPRNVANLVGDGCPQNLSKIALWNVPQRLVERTTAGNVSG